MRYDVSGVQELSAILSGPDHCNNYSMSEYSLDFLLEAHKHSSLHKEEILKSAECGCFYCKSTFHPREIEVWVDEDNPKGATALCANCAIDSVIGSASGFPVSDLPFLVAMNKYWF